MPFSRGCVAFLMLLLCVAMPARAADDVAISASADVASAKAGQTVTLSITIDIPEGLHTQSHIPSDPNYIALNILPAKTPGLEFGKPEYPPGKDETYPGLGTLNVYTGQVVVRVPVKILADAPAGAIKVAGNVRYQACNDSVCFPPKRAPFAVDLTVAGGSGPATAPANAQANSLTPPTTAPTTTSATASSAAVVDLPSADEAAGDAGAFGFLKRFFTLADDAYGSTFLLAFLVGIVFNAVPCVLPVVPLKILGFYEAAQHDRRKCFLLGLAFSVGLVASFGVLAVLVVGLKTLTWGGLFQQTWFTIAIVVVLLVMAASQFGLFTINLPTAAYGFTPRHDTYAGNAMFGVLTAALSTPCTIGPFSALLAWSLKQPSAIGSATIVIVGCGMAAPYLILSAFPQVMRRFPRTGPIGEIIKQTLAFFVLATAVYFARPLVGAWVNPTVFWWGLFAIIAVGCLFMVGRMVKTVGTSRAIGVSAAIAVITIAGSAYATSLFARNPHDWQPYSDQALADAIKAGRPVLIDFTADWCLNCHTLEAITLNDGDVVKTVLAEKVLMLKADVTHGDEAAVPLKNRLLPAGEIPLTAVYLPGKTEPTLLKGIYSVGELLTVLPRAG